MRDLENNPRHILSEEARYRDVFTPRQKSEFLFVMNDGNIGRIYILCDNGALQNYESSSSIYESARRLRTADV